MRGGRRKDANRAARYRVFFLSRGRMEASPGKTFREFESAREYAVMGGGLDSFCVIQRLHDKRVVWIDYSAI